VLGESGHVNWIELLWVIEGLVGMALSGWAFYSAIKDWRAIEIAGLNHGMHIVARTNLQMEIFRIIPHMFVVSIGLIAWTYAPSPYPHDQIGWAVTAMLFGIPVCAAINSLNVTITRRKILQENLKGGK
jgi:hypothetical protein